MNFFRRFPGILIGLFILFLTGCREEEQPRPQLPSSGNGLEVITNPLSLVFSNGDFSVGGAVTSSEGFTILGKGVCFGLTAQPKIQTDSVISAGPGFGVFTSQFSLPDFEREWFVRSFAISSSSAGRTDTTYGNQLIIKPFHQIKTLRLNASGIDSIRLSWDGLQLCKVNGLQTVAAKGICWGLNPNPRPSQGNFLAGSGSDTVGISSLITGLQAGQLYYFRAFAATSADTVFGVNVGCSTGLLDADGNDYPTLLIGKQVWLGSNLRTGRFSDGSPIEENPDNARWDTLTSPANGFSADNRLYGKYYNFYCINNEKNLCPAGWRIPSRQDWDTLFMNFGGWENAGLALKASNTSWGSSIPEGQGSSGFNALPADRKSVV